VNSQTNISLPLDLRCFVSAQESGTEAGVILLAIEIQSVAPANEPLGQIDGHSLQLQSDSKPSVRQPLTVNNAREGPQVSHE